LGRGISERKCQYHKEIIVKKIRFEITTKCTGCKRSCLFSHPIVEAEARLRPKNNKIQEQAAQARESAQATGMAQEPREEKFEPSENLKKLYRDVAKRIHPDLAIDEKERARRQQLMADANCAYEEGDEAKLWAILAEWESSPEAFEGEGTAEELIRVIRKIAQVEKRLRVIETEIAQLEKSELYQLKQMSMWLKMRGEICLLKWHHE